MHAPHTTFTPSATYDEALDRAATAWGIEREYWDIFGRHHPAPQEVKRSILEALGVDASSVAALDAAVEQRLWQEWCRPLPKTLVVSVNGPAEIEVSLPEPEAASTIRLEIVWEDSGSSSNFVEFQHLPLASTAELRGRRFVRKRAPLPAPLRLGYHKLVCYPAALANSGHAVVCNFIVCPDRAWCPPELSGDSRKAAGIIVSLYGLRSDRNWGCGDTTDLEKMLDWLVEDVRGSFLGLNPLHAIPNRTPYNTSPYLPNCTFYRNFIYIDPTRAKEFAESPRAIRLFASEKFQKTLQSLRDSEFVEYEKVARLKIRFMKLLFRRFLENYRQGTACASEFEAWCRAEGELLDRYATYCALDEVLHKRDRNVWLWTQWPEEYRDPESPAVKEFARKHWRLVLFYKYLQWELDRQLEAVQRYAKSRNLSIGLYHDLALATDRYGSDLWAHRRFYVAGARVGSPPDDFSPNGQDWSFPPPHSEHHRDDGYRHFAETIRKSCRHGGALRIDHVMRFFRLFWIPEGMTAAQGTYVRENHEDLLRILALESVRQKVVIIGEDLGTVEPGVREALERFGILSYRLFYFEKHGDGRFRLPHEYPRHALVSPTTHDLPTLAGFWEGKDIVSRRAAGVIDDAIYLAQMNDRLREKQKILDMLFSLNLLPAWFQRSAAQLPYLTGELHNAIIGFLASTPSLLLAINQEDLTKETQQQNLPGTTAEYPNWRRKMRYTVSQLRTEPEAGNFTAMIRHWISRTNRGNV
ncbi:MAG: 4-alpha-glucanotransferase [Bryobacteraceae bacterium]|nr:4-alpha-glucanotransferase [Bryobacteraceae bacterium]